MTEKLLQDCFDYDKKISITELGLSLSINSLINFKCLYIFTICMLLKTNKESLPVSEIFQTLYSNSMGNRFHLDYILNRAIHNGLIEY